MEDAKCEVLIPANAQKGDKIRSHLSMREFHPEQVPRRRIEENEKL
jgi:hypothetical protein